MQLSTGFRSNAIILINAPRLGEDGLGRRLAEDLEQMKISIRDFHFERHDIESLRELFVLLRYVTSKTKKGMRPILHFNMHGDRSRGLQVGKAREFIPWDQLASWLRRINIRTKNNLCVVAAACHGLYMIKPITILKETPFFCLIAPEKEVPFGFVDDRMTVFYRELLTTLNLDSAENVIDEHFHFFYSEVLLTKSLIGYIKTGCKGKGFRQRKERLITEALLSGFSRDRETLRALRKLVKAGTEPTQYLIDKYAERFLVGGYKSQVTLNMLMNEIENG